MKTDQDDILRQELRKWCVKTPLPPRFQGHVWQRIAAAESKANFDWWQTFKAGIAVTFRRPAFAAAYIAMVLLIGLATGYRQANQKAAQAESLWRTLYVQTVDPYQMPHDQR